jgi:hypothetical protein
MNPSTSICETDHMVESLVHVSMRFQIQVRCPAVTDDHSARFDPRTNNIALYP